MSSPSSSSSSVPSASPSSSDTSPPLPPTTTPPPTTTTTLPDSRRLFQRLWTDEDEINLLNGFLHYSSSSSDTSAFFHHIKPKIQLDFNKNQLLEKLRRLKKKYRNVNAKITSGKHFSFKSSHDQATFEISSKIWGHLDSKSTPRNTNNPTFDYNNNNTNNNSRLFINLNTSAAGGNDQKPPPRKRPKVEEKFVSVNLSGNNNSDGINVRAEMQGMIEEKMKGCLAGVVKDAVEKAVKGAGIKGVEAMALNAITGVNCGDDKWRKQQIMELEVYSKRLELVQEQIKLTLDELRSIKQL